MHFTKHENDFVKLLVDIGTRRNVAHVLVFLTNAPEATSRDIERGTDLRQPEVSMAMQYLTRQKWISNRESKAEGKGRPVKIYRLAKPISEVMDVIEREKRQKAKKQLNLIKKLQNFIRKE
jgi:predicted transcriptional regulator